MKNPSLTRHAALVGVFGVLLFILCLLWRVVLTDPAVIEHHLLSLKTVFPGFRGMDALSMLWGAVLSFVYFFLGSLAVHALHKNCACCKK